MAYFSRDDGVALKLMPELAARLRERPSAKPNADWSDRDYAAGARTKIERWKRRLQRLQSSGINLSGARVLDLGCGNGVDCLLMGLEPVSQVVGIDMRIPGYHTGMIGARHRRLAAAVLGQVGQPADPWAALCKLPVCLVEGDAADLPFEDSYFNVILSKSFLEHMIPIETAFAEMERVLAPGGVMYHVIDPYFWLRGCHEPGLVAIPWAHARLDRAEYRRFVTEQEGPEAADRRCRFQESLNRFTLRDYRAVWEASPFEILDWRETRSGLAEEALREDPGIAPSALEGLRLDDLVCDSIRVLARKQV